MLVYGASGSVGSFAVQLAKYYGAHVTGVCSTSNLEWVNALGADEVLDYKIEDFSKKGKTYDVIFEAVNKSSFVDCMKCLKQDGTYINITEPLPSARMLWTSLTTKKNILLSRNSPETVEALEFLNGLIEDGALNAIIDRTYLLEEIVEAHRYVEKGHKRGNVVIMVN